MVMKQHVGYSTLDDYADNRHHLVQSISSSNQSPHMKVLPTPKAVQPGIITPSLTSSKPQSSFLAEKQANLLLKAHTQDKNQE